MDDLQEKMAAGEPLMRQAISAMKRYHEAKDLGAPVEEVHRLLLEAESLMQAVTEYQLHALGGEGATRH